MGRASSAGQPNLTRVHLRFSDLLAQRLYGGDAQVLGITQIFGQPADREAVSMKARTDRRG